MEPWAAADAGCEPLEAASSEVAAFFPLVVFPRRRERHLTPERGELRDAAQRYLPRVGAILYRGFGIAEDQDFERFVARGAQPGRLWVWCAGVPAPGERAFLADRREIYRRIPAPVRERWAQRRILYTRHFDAAALRACPELSGDGGRAAMAAWCLENGLCCEWDRHGGVRLSRVCSPSAMHPVTGEALWCDPLLSGSDTRHRAAPAHRWRVTHADGSCLDPADVAQVRAAVESCRTGLPWETGDVLLLDEALVAHAFSPEDGGATWIAHRPD